jgi:8-oxo-dGTP diphosphatase
MEGGESFESCAIRKVEEETGIILQTAKVLTVVNQVYHNEHKHYVVVLMMADLPPGQEARLMEPNKCEGWQWFLRDQLPWPLMPHIQQIAHLLPELLVQ